MSSTPCALDQLQRKGDSVGRIRVALIINKSIPDPSPLCGKIKNFDGVNIALYVLLSSSPNFEFFVV